MPRSLRDEDKILERTESPGLSKRALIILGTVVYVLGVASGVQIASVIGVGVCPTTPAGPASMPAPRAVAPAPVPEGGAPAVPLPVPQAKPKAAPALVPEAIVATPREPAPPAATVTPPAPVATPPAVIAATPGQVYAIQVKSFPSLEEAGELARLLKEGGFPAFVVSTTLPDKGEVHRVRVGDYPNRAAAETAATELEDKMGLTSFVTVSLD
ncbi:MAG: SPOR domain-containing protein [Nitrospirota bacterium]|jgi:DedD protein